MNQRGFTYVELLIVVGVLLIFSAFFVVVVNPVQRLQAARDDTREEHLNTILLGIEQKLSSEGEWSCPGRLLPQDKFTTIGTGSGEYDLYSCLMPNYLSKYLVDPKEGSIAGRDITDGLVGHWKFDEGSGTTAYDASGNGNDGTIVNSPTWVDGKMGEALDFNGSSNYVDAGNDESLNITDAITIEAWVKQKENNDGYVIMKNTANDSKRLYSIWSEGTANAIHFFYYSNGYQQITWNYTLDDNTWHHIVITVSGTTAKLYVDKVSQGDRTLAGAFQGDVNAKVKIGRREPNNYYFNGLIDDVRIYNRALSPEEIQDLYNYEYSSKYAIWQNPVTKNISLKSLEDETKEVFTGAPELALNFDGSGDYVDIGDKEAFHLNEAGTIGAWVNIPSVWTGTLYPNLISKGAAAGWDTAGWALYNFKDNRLGVGMRNESTVFACHYVNTIKDQWLYVVGTWNGSNVLVYSNGIIKQSCDQTINPQVNSYKLRIAHDDRPTSPHFFPGQISDVRIYDRALSAEEVEQLYKGYDIRNGLVGHWPLNEGQGTTAYDRSGNGNDGTLIGGPTWTTK